ncbi:hypothetical protein PR048_001315 [Dryococelus australis]|uniref:Uncharacterized protein n=1 Tax=Dryococelus australis TaxID=614101 RepID=A0ABQ9IID6_9NEOP|nr:hypothetical protein PR048_001315 [Dryococelus australis]
MKFDAQSVLLFTETLNCRITALRKDLTDAIKQTSHVSPRNSDFPRAAVGVLARTFTCHQGKLGSIPGGHIPGFSLGGLVLDDATGWRFFSWSSTFPRPCIPTLLHTHPASPSSALKILLPHFPEWKFVTTEALQSSTYRAEILTEFKESVLQRGLNFSIVPSKVSKLEIVAFVESVICKLLPKEQEEFRCEIGDVGIAHRTISAKRRRAQFNLFTPAKAKRTSRIPETARGHETKVSMEQRRSPREGEMEDPRENPSTNGIWHNSHMRNPGATPPAISTTRFTLFVDDDVNILYNQQGVGMFSQVDFKSPQSTREAAVPNPPVKISGGWPTGLKETGGNSGLRAKISSWLLITSAEIMDREEENDLIFTVQCSHGNTSRLVRRSDEALGVCVTVARIAPSLLDLGRAAT